MHKSSAVEGQIIEIVVKTNCSQQSDASKDKLDDRVRKQSASGVGGDVADDQYLLGVIRLLISSAAELVIGGVRYRLFKHRDQSFCCLSALFFLISRFF
jgi:hypothetical protein